MGGGRKEENTRRQKGICKDIIKSWPNGERSFGKTADRKDPSCLQLVSN